MIFRLLRFFLAALLIFVVHLPTVAQAGEIHSVLLPIPVHPVNGANGSRWESEFYMRNSGSEPVCLVGVTIPICHNASLTERLHEDVTGPRILQFEGPIENVHFALGVRDAARQGESFGAEIPIVPLDEFQRDEIELINVPTLAGFRRNLRLYAATSQSMALRVRIWDRDQDVHRDDASPTPVLLSEATYVLDKDNWWLSLPDFDQRFPKILAVDRIRVEIDRLDGPGTFWAFMTITNNETHHITTASPWR